MDATELHELLELYRENLSTLLTENKLEIIKVFTEQARLNEAAAKHLVHVIHQHILSVDGKLKLIGLYLVDSIVKNVGRSFIPEFSARLPELIKNIWGVGDENIRARVKRVIASWDTKPWNHIFSRDTLAAVTAIVDPPTSSQQHRVVEPPSARAMPSHGGDPRRRGAAPAAPLATQNGSTLNIQQTVAQPMMYPGQSMPFPVAVHQKQHAFVPPPSYPPTSVPYYQGQHPSMLPPQPPQFQLSNAEQQLVEYRQGLQQPTPPTPKSTVPSSAHLQAAKAAKVAQANIKEFNPVVLNLLKQRSQKTKSFILDDNVRRRQRRLAAIAPSRQWYAPEDLWIAGTAHDVIDDNAAADEMIAEAAEEEAPVTFSVPKDDAQLHCAISLEPFKEEWDSEKQEWVFANAVRLTKDVAEELGLHEGAIVKVPVLDQDVLDRIVAAQKEAPASAADDASAPPASSTETSVYWPDASKRPFEVSMPGAHLPGAHLAPHAKRIRL